MSRKAKAGINLPNGRGQQSFQRLLELAQYAEQLGFDSIWVSDHLVPPDLSRIFGSNARFESLTSLAALSTVTSRIKLGSNVMLPLRHPILVANMVSTLDHASKGRFILGLGVGSHKPEYDTLGLPFNQRGIVLNEMIQALKQLWIGKEASFKGKLFSFNVALEMKPVQSPHPPIWIGGASPAAIRRAARYGDAWIPTDMTVEEYQSLLPVLRDECLRRDGKLNAPSIAANLYASISSSRELARREAEFLSRMTGEKMESVEKWAVIGSPEDAVHRVGAYIDAGVQYFVFSIPPWGKEEAVMRSIRGMF
jgi:probable F420-dependent oxidoreductase